MIEARAARYTICAVHAYDTTYRSIGRECRARTGVPSLEASIGMKREMRVIPHTADFNL